MENKPEQTLENMLDNMSLKDKDMVSGHLWSIRDFNNVETADRKLIINKKFEFWVHDDCLTSNSDYFACVFGKMSNQELNAAINQSLVKNHEENDFKQTNIIIPHEDFFFDVLVYMYTKNGIKLKKAAKEVKSFLYLLSLGVFLKMKEDYFEVLLTDIKFDWKVESFQDPLWSRTIFTFPILERIIRQMPGENLNKVIALLSWLKVIDQDTNTILNEPENIEDTLTSHDLFYVRNFIKKNKLMMSLPSKEIIKLKKDFSQYTSAFDSYGIINNFILGEGLHCIVCKKDFASPFKIMEELECKANNQEFKYHPRCTIKNEKMICNHEGCRKKFWKGEYPCCHKKLDSKEGCQIGEGKHIIVLEQ